MTQKMIASMVLTFFAMSCSAMTNLQEREKMYGNSISVITESFASPTMIAGDTWKVYLKAFDPDGDAKYIVAQVYQTGRGEYSPSYIRIKEENAKEINGYIYLNTLVPGGYEFLNFILVELTVQVQDRAGHYSKPVMFRLSFNPRATQEPPPPGVFKEQALGPIMVTLRPFDADGRGGEGFF